MLNSLHQPNELPLIHCGLEMARGKRPAEDGSRALLQDDPEPRTRGFAVHREDLVEVWHLEDRPYGEDALERPKGGLRLVVPGERVSL